ncbi:MAG TPA: hypothetical protein VJ625_00460, partial [Propionibacteriaceae bacterium]|nr:hypothetical protein [Propionibacteriaceae bacterium]
NEGRPAFLPGFEEAVMSYRLRLRAPRSRFMSPAKVVTYGNRIAGEHAGSDHLRGWASEVIQPDRAPPFGGGASGGVLPP